MAVNHQHNSDRFAVTWGNLNMLKGLAKGSLVSDSGITGGWSWRGDAHGGGVYSFDPDQSGALTFQVESANILHQQLVALWNTDRASRNVVADLLVTNNDTQEQYLFHASRIQRPPGFDLSTESPIVSWVLLYAGMTYIPNLNNNNVIGIGVLPALPAET